MNLLHAAIGTALAYAGDLPRALVRGAIDHALDRGLGLLASHRPTRVVAREDYILRSYLVGRMGHGFPEGTPATLGGLDGTAYLHRIGTPDSGRAHHSHPWEWAISIVLTGGYVEELVEPDGTVVTRSRPPGSVGVLTSSTFHRIAELGAPQAWTLFIVGPRTQNRDWYFRRLDASIVHEAEYHAHLEAEHAAEEAWLAAREAERLGVRGRVAVVNDGGRVALARPSFPVRVYDGDVAPVPSAASLLALPRLSVADAARAFDAAIKRGGAGVIVSPPTTMREAIAAMEPLGWRHRRPFLLVTDVRWAYREIRLVDPESKPVHGAATPTWVHAGTEDMLAATAPLVAAGVEVFVSDASEPLVVAREQPAAPEGYTFETLSPSPTIVIRCGDGYIGSLLTNGRAVAHGRELRPAEVEKHAAAWAHARKLRGGA
jgi:hypothetical protein